MPTGRVIAVKGRFSRKIGYGGKYAVFERFHGCLAGASTCSSAVVTSSRPLDSHKVARHGRVLTVRCRHGPDLGRGHCLHFCRVICRESLDNVRERAQNLVIRPSATAQLFAVEAEIVFRRANGSSCADPLRAHGDADFLEKGIHLPLVELFRVFDVRIDQKRLLLPCRPKELIERHAAGGTVPQIGSHRSGVFPQRRSLWCEQALPDLASDGSPWQL